MNAVEPVFGEIVVLKLSMPVLGGTGVQNVTPAMLALFKIRVLSPPV